MAWTDADLKIFAAGMAVGGKFNLANISDYKPAVWNDSGEYDHIYLDFQIPLAPFSTAQFIDAVLLYGKSGPISIGHIETVSARVVKVWCDVSTETAGIQIIGKSGSWLAFTGGGGVPGFAMWTTIAGLSSYVKLAWIYDLGKIKQTISTNAETVGCVLDGYCVQTVSEIGVITIPSSAGAEDVGITYS